MSSAIPTTVDLVIHSARLLKHFDAIYSRQSPFCEISVDGQVVDRTATHKDGNLKPIWKQRFGVVIPPNTQYVVLRVYIEHSIRLPTLCGECFIPISAVPELLTDFSLKLEKRQEKTGEIDVSIHKITSTAMHVKMKADLGQQLMSQMANLDLADAPPKPQIRGNVLPQLPQPLVQTPIAPAPCTAELKAGIFGGKQDALKHYAYTVFAAFDTTQPLNLLQLHEYKAACQFIARDLGVPSPSDNILARIFKKYDVNGDGVLKREEFLQMLSTLLLKVQALQPQMNANAEAKAGDVHAPQPQVHCTQVPQPHVSPASPVVQAAPMPRNNLRTERRFIDAYSYGTKLGEGAFGVVYQCRARQTKLERVCKVVNKAKCQMPVAEIKMEAKLLAKLDHPHIQRVFEYFEDSCNFYFIFDPCAGGELMAIVKAANDRNMMLTEEWVAKVMKGTMLALAYVHQRHIMHKDLKLENVLLLNKTNPYEDPHVVVIDFGLAEMFYDDQTNNRVAGTPTYMAPEVWNRSFGPKCDVWSAGVMIFFLLTGSLPFRGTSMDDLRARICQGVIPWQALSHNTQEARDIVQSMLQVDDARRPSAARCVTHVWFQDQGTNTHKRNVTLSKEILQNLSKVAEMATFEKAVCQMVAGQLSNTHMNEITDIFKALDVDNNGVLSVRELTKGLRTLGIDDATIPKVISALDVNNTGYVSYTEFCGGMLAGIMQDRDHLLWIGFQQLDDNGTGRIEVTRFQHALIARGIGKLDVSADAIVKELDSDGTGYVTWDNFRAYFRRAHHGVREMMSYRE